MQPLLDTVHHSEVTILKAWILHGCVSTDPFLNVEPGACLSARRNWILEFATTLMPLTCPSAHYLYSKRHLSSLLTNWRARIHEKCKVCLVQESTQYRI
jgi:hypothetical protein